MKSLTRNSSEKPEDRSALKQSYLACLNHLAAGTETLRTMVWRLAALRVGRQILVRWAVEAGYSERYIRSLLSRLFAEAGARLRKPGAGPKTPREALELLNIATDRHGERAGKFLRAAARAARTLREELAARSQSGDMATAHRPIHFLISYRNKPGVSCDPGLTGRLDPLPPRAASSTN